MTQAISGFGTLLKRNSTAVAEVVTIGGPSLTRETIDATHLTSPDRWREFIKGLKDGGEVSMDLNYLPWDSTHNVSTGLLSDFNNDSSSLDSYDMVFPDTAGTTFSFSAIVTKFEPNIAGDDKLAASVTLKISGKPTLA